MPALRPMIAGLIAAAVVAGAELTGRRGVDLAATVFRVDQFRRHGLTLWDSAWYGGHWTLDYSAIYPPLAAALGIAVLAVLSAGAAAACFDRLVRPALGGGGWAASVLFALGTLVTAAIGQMPFLTGEAWGLAALCALAGRRTVGAASLALLCGLTSPLPAAFLALATAAWGLAGLGAGSGRRGRLGPSVAVIAAALAPVAVTLVLFPGQGAMPYPFTDYAWEVVIAAAIGLLAGRAHPAVGLGAGLFIVAATLAEVVPSALGGNVGRIEDVAALPLAVGLAWTRARLALPVVAVPLALSQWAPAWGALTTIPSSPSATRAFYTPLDRELARLSAGGRAGRVEVVPTAYHWEAAYVAPAMPLARGWERQLDEADNPLFYGPHLAGRSYREWLMDNGVRFVALPRAPLDMAGQAEGTLVASGLVPGLDPVWSSTDWRLYSVTGSPGIVSGPATLVSAADGRVVIDATGPGTVTLRVRYSPGWSIDEGAACLTRTRGAWMELSVPAPERITLSVSPWRRGGRDCSP